MQIGNEGGAAVAVFNRGTRRKRLGGSFSFCSERDEQSGVPSAHRIVAEKNTPRNPPSTLGLTIRVMTRNMDVCRRSCSAS